MTGEPFAGARLMPADPSLGTASASPRVIRVVFREAWAPPQGRGLLDSDTRVRTLRKVIVTYPDVRHVLPDSISLDAAADERVLETVVRFLQRQHWLVKSVTSA